MAIVIATIQCVFWRWTRAYRVKQFLWRIKSKSDSATAVVLPGFVSWVTATIFRVAENAVFGRAAKTVYGVIFA